MPSPRDLLPQVYDVMRRLATARLAHEKPGHSLDANAPVHGKWCPDDLRSSREP
jgi:hypothetical protein